MTVFVLGGAQTDFARNYAKEGRGTLELFAEVVPAALADAGVTVEDVEVAHVGNLAAELFTGQAQLGGLHDCFMITGLVALEHLGAAPPGDGGKFIADGGINPGGGLIGLGHPVGATGVRMLHDVARLVSGTAGATQVAGARTALTLNVGSSFTTVVTMIVQASA
jgi:acetyl-CoA acetyltransferase